MKLSEVIKAIEDGNERMFVNCDFKIAKSVYGESVYFQINSSLPLDGWEEVVPPKQWSEKELMLFKLLPDWAKWIAKNQNGKIWYHESKPELVPIHDYVSYGSRDFLSGSFCDVLTITFKESPIYIGDLKGE